MHRSLWVILTLCAVLSQSAPGQIANVNEFTLSNGLKVLLVEDHTVPSVCVATVFRVGSRNEKPGITGISHLFEHMMFNGSRKYLPTEFDKILEGGGGYSNAYTGHDITFYFEEFNPDLLEKVLDMEADRMRALKLDSENLEQERGIVKEERRVATDNDIRGKMFEDLYATAFMVHPYRHPIGGWMKDLDNITLQNAKDYFHTYYAPNNATIIMVGAFDAGTLQRKVKKLFGAIPRGPAPPGVTNAEPPQLGERRVKLHKLAELPAVAVGYKGAPVSSLDFYALDLLTTILSTGQSSRMYTRLVHELQVAADVAGGVEECVDPGLVVFYLQSQPGRAIADAEAELYKILTDVADNGVREEELQKAKNFAQMTYANEFKTNVGIAERLARFEGIYGGYRLSFEMPDRYRKVTTDDIKRVARAYLTERQRSVVVLVPEKMDDHAAEQRGKE
jgi:zinc protease